MLVMVQDKSTTVTLDCTVTLSVVKKGQYYSIVLYDALDIEYTLGSYFSSGEAHKELWGLSEAWAAYKTATDTGEKPHGPIKPMWQMSQKRLQ